MILRVDGADSSFQFLILCLSMQLVVTFKTGRNLEINMSMTAGLRGWKYAAFIGGIIGFIGAATYPIIIYPLMNVEHYSKFFFIFRLERCKSIG